jgi:putative copper resistance protein D
MHILLIIVRLAHYADVSVLFGLAAFRFYARVPGDGGHPPAWMMQGLGILAVVTTAMVLDVQAALMVGEGRALIQFSVVRGVVAGTVFGMVWGLRLVLAAGVAYLACRREPMDKWLALGSGLLLITIAFAGHSRLPSGFLGFLHVFVDGLHLIAAGAWIGGLFALLRAMRLRRLGAGGPAATLLHQFSGMGYYAVAVLIATGIVKSLLLLGSPGGIFTPWGFLLLIKLLLFAAMGALALSNRNRIIPALEARPKDPLLWIGRLRKQVIWEFSLGLGVLAVVSIMGTLPPPVSL